MLMCGELSPSGLEVDSSLKPARYWLQDLPCL